MCLTGGRGQSCPGHNLRQRVSCVCMCESRLAVQSRQRIRVDLSASMLRFVCRSGSRLNLIHISRHTHTLPLFLSSLLLCHPLTPYLTLSSLTRTHPATLDLFPLSGKGQISRKDLSWWRFRLCRSLRRGSATSQSTRRKVVAGSLPATLPRGLHGLGM